MLTMPHLSAMLWNPLNELQKTTRGTTNTYFNYSGGERIRKVAEKSGGILEQRIYLGSYEIYRKFVSGSLTIERTTVHVSDDTGRIAMLEVRTVGSDSAPASLQRYIYSNHLQSASLELDENADIISYEEYHPFGTTAYSASNTAINAIAKRYRYTGKERDGKTGLYYLGARYYIPWIGRWSACDPLESKYAGMSPYNYSMNNPIIMNDPSGMEGEDSETRAKFAEGEKRTKAMFQSKLDEVANSKADPEFKKWFAEIGLEGLTSFRDALYENKLKPYEEHWLSESLYGRTSEGNIAVPYEIRKQLWNEAISETVSTLKSVWAAQQSGETSGILFTHYRNLTVSNREEGWDAIKSAGVKVGLEWALHLGLGGFSNLMKTTSSLAERNALYQLSQMEKSISGAHFLSRHGAQTTLAQQLERATTGLTPEGVAGKASDASRFLSHQVELQAVKKAEFIFQQTGKTSFSFSMEKTIGEGYLRKGTSVVQTTNVQAVFRNGKLYTMYPKLR